MYETRGRKNVVTYVDGGLYTVKKPQKLAVNTTAIIIPKDWICTLEEINGKPVKYYLLDVKDTFITIKPYFDEIPDMEG